MRAIIVYLSVVFLSLLANNPLLANRTLSYDIPDSEVKIFKNAEDALKFSASSKGEFYLEAGTYTSEEQSLKRQFHLSREIHYPVIVEVRGTRHIVLVGPLYSAFAVRQLKNEVFLQTKASKKVDMPIINDKPESAARPHSPYGSGAIIIDSQAKASTCIAPANGLFYIQAGAFKSEINSRNYQHALLKKVHYPVIIERRGNFNVVLIGPVHSVTDVRALSSIVFGSPSV